MASNPRIEMTDQIKEKFMQDEKRILQMVELASLNGQDHLYFRPSAEDNRHHKLFPNIIDTLQPESFRANYFGEREITIDAGFTPTSDSSPSDRLSLNEDLPRLSRVSSTYAGALFESLADLQRMSSGLMGHAYFETLLLALPMSTTPGENLAAFVCIAECLSQQQVPELMTEPSNEQEIKEIKIKNYWRTALTQQIANREDFSARLAAYVANIPVDSLKAAKFSDGIDGTPFEFLVNLKKGLRAVEQQMGIRTTKSHVFANAMVAAKFDAKVSKSCGLEVSALDAAIAAHRNKSSFAAKCGFMTRTSRKVEAVVQESSRNVRSMSFSSVSS